MAAGRSWQGHTGIDMPLREEGFPSLAWSKEGALKQASRNCGG